MMQQSSAARIATENCSVELITPACSAGECGQCAGRGAGGFWKFAGMLELMNVALKESFPNGVRCPCQCHFEEEQAS